jgi:neocarzinostatin family protein
MAELTTPIPVGRPDRTPGVLRQRLLLLGLLLVLIGGLGIAVVISADNPPDPDADPDADVEPVAIELAGAYDGLDSLGLPVAATPDIGLVDGQMITLRGSGFDPEVTIGWSQCRFRTPTAGQDDCDLGNIGIGTTDSEGNFDVEFSVKRYVAAASGTFDCVQATLDDGCSIGVGTLSDYDKSGRALIFFDPASDGEIPPRIEVDQTVGLLDGQELLVTGTGFVPDEVAFVTQCPIGGSNGIGSCYGENQVGVIQVDGQGNFAITVPALRVVTGRGGDVDCFTSAYRCLLIVQAARTANTVPLLYDGAAVLPREVEFTVSPNENLVDGQTISLELFDLPVEGTITVEQCVDQGPVGVSCSGAADATVVAGDATTDAVVARFITNADGENIDCADSARTCYLQVSSVDLEPRRIPIHFAPA